MNFPRHLAWVAMAAFVLVLSIANVPAAGADSESPQDFLQRNYGLKITIQNEDRESGILHLGPLTNTGQLDDYLQALVVECKKYPSNFFSKAGVSEIVLCGDLGIGDAPISGLFSQQQRKLFLKYYWGPYGARYRATFHAFHHELGHALQCAVWGNGHYDWPDWEAVNPPGFHYGGGGGVELMEHPEKNWATWSTDQPGFLNAYSTSAPWEDRSEIMAALMNNANRAFLPPYYQRDPIIQKKVDLMAQLLTNLCGPDEAKYYWEQAVISLKGRPASALAQNQPPPPQKVDLEKAIGGDLIDASGNAVDFETLKGKKYFLLYFSASWCSHCRQFMPQFLEFYQNSTYHDDFEVIFVSSDKTESQMLSYLREMPWKAVRLNSPGESFLKTNYSKGPGIPTLVLIDSDGRMLDIRKGFAPNYQYGVDNILDILNQKLSSPPNNTELASGQ